VSASLSRFHSLSVRSLPQLLALLLYSAHGENSIVEKIENVGLLVIDDLSTPVLAAYPAGYEEDIRNKANRKDFDSPSNKRNNLLKELANKLASLAIKRKLSVVAHIALTDQDYRSQPIDDQSLNRKQCKPRPCIG
jgi:hypothetical protein